MKPAAKVAVVVVSYASASTLGECLTRLLSCPEVAQLVLVDNASPDHSVQIARALAAKEPRLRVVANRENTGFAAACNLGATAASAPWLALVNPDVYVGPETFAKLLAQASAHPGVGLLGAELRDSEGRFDPAARRSDPQLGELLRSFGRSGAHVMGRDPAQAVQKVDAVSGAFMLLPTGLFQRIGGFDEGYRLHAEDLDLCRRVREGGYDVAIANEVVVTHVRGVSSRARPIWVELQKHRGLWRYFRKFEGRNASAALRGLVATALALRFLLKAPQAWLRARD